MIQPVNPGCLLPFFHIDDERQITKLVTKRPSGWKITGTREFLLPFILWFDTPAQTVDAFELINLDTGLLYSVNPAKIGVRERDDLTKSWYFWRGTGLTDEDFPCGKYKIQVTLSTSGVFVSDIIQIVDVRNAEELKLIQGACVGSTLTINVQNNLSLSSSVVSETARWRYSTSNIWNNETVSGGTFDITPVVSTGLATIIIEKTTLSDSGNFLQVVYAIDYDQADFCGTATMRFVKDVSTYKHNNWWSLNLEDSKLWGDNIIFESNYKQRVYFEGFVDNPEPERSETVLIDNLGNENPSTGDTKNYSVIAMRDIPDQMAWILSAIGDFETATLTSHAGIFTRTLDRATISFEPLASGFNRGTLKFLANKYFDRQCLETEVLAGG
jgi:hypothetical protein